MILGFDGYVVRSTHSGRRNPHGKGSVRDWWLVKAVGEDRACIALGRAQVRVPVVLLGKRVRLKVEVLGAWRK